MKEANISVVVPALNEQELLNELYKRLSNSLDNIDKDYEIIFVDDGSTDETLNLLKELNRNDQRVKSISFSRNFGHQTAISAGLSFSSGVAVIIMDADLQDPPEILPKFIEKWKAGYKVVYGIRRFRKEIMFKRVAYKVFYRVLKSISRIDIPLDAGDFCLMDRKVVDIINGLPERARFVRGLRSWAGFSQIGLEYERDRRLAGKAKYDLYKLLKLAIDGIISFSDFPLRMAIAIGSIVSTLSIIYAGYITYLRLFSIYEIPGWATIVVAITFLGGVQLIMLGVLGSYISRIFDEVKARPLYIISETVGFEESKDG